MCPAQGHRPPRSSERRWFRRAPPPTRQNDRLGGSAAAVDQRHRSASSNKIRTPPTQPSVRQHQRSADEGRVDRGRQLNTAAITEQPPRRSTDEAAAPPSRNRLGAGKGAAAKFVRPGLKPPSAQRRGGAATGCARRRGTARRGAPNAAGFVAPPPLLVRTTD